MSQTYGKDLNQIERMYRENKALMEKAAALEAEELTRQPVQRPSTEGNRRQRRAARKAKP